MHTPHTNTHTFKCVKEGIYAEVEKGISMVLPPLEDPKQDSPLPPKPPDTQNRA